MHAQVADSSKRSFASKSSNSSGSSSSRTGTSIRTYPNTILVLQGAMEFSDCLLKRCILTRHYVFVENTVM